MNEITCRHCGWSGPYNNLEYIDTLGRCPVCHKIFSVEIKGTVKEFEDFCKDDAEDVPMDDLAKQREE